MSSCTICTHITCRGGNRCGVLHRLYAIKLEAMYSFGDIHIDLDHLKSLPKDFFMGLEHIKRVFLKNNDFVELPFWFFEHLWDLQELNISDNKHLNSILYALPSSISYITIRNCTQFDIYEFSRVLRFPKLRMLCIENCGLKCIPTFSWNAPQLVKLSLADNRIRNIKKGAFTRFKSLQELNLDNNQLRTFDPAWIAPEAPLSVLNLYGNRISYLPSFAPFAKTLNAIDLGNNRIRDIVPDLFKSCSQLRSIVLEGNKLARLPQGLFIYQHDIYVNVSNNPLLSYIEPGCFAQAPSYLDIEIKNCPRLLLPHEGIVDNGITLLTEIMDAQAEMDRVIAKSRFEMFHEELMASLFHPSRVEKMIEKYGIEIIDAF